MGMGVVKLLGYLRQARRREGSPADYRTGGDRGGARRKEAEVEAKELALQEKAKIEDQLNEIATEGVRSRTPARQAAGRP